MFDMSGDDLGWLMADGDQLRLVFAVAADTVAYYLTKGGLRLMHVLAIIDFR
jgi:hypothetical protein